MTDCRKQYGYWKELPDEYAENPDGEWEVYYRTVKEDGEIIFPEAFDEAGLTKLMETDFWTYMTQYVNNPYVNENTELSQFQPKKCFVDFDHDRGFVISTEWGEEILLRDCDVIVAIDPAATERGISAKTSRSVLAVWATDWKGRKFLVELRADFVPITKLFDWMFEVGSKYASYLRAMYLEAQGPFKIMVPMLRKEENDRKQSLPLRAVPASGDKIARIRTAWLPILDKGLVHVVASAWATTYEEIRVFPGGRRMDVLDAIEIAERNSILPGEPGDPELEFDIDDQRFLVQAEGRNPVTGY
jgi:hypothetical protein